MSPILIILITCIGLVGPANHSGMGKIKDLLKKIRILFMALWIVIAYSNSIYSMGKYDPIDKEFYVKSNRAVAYPLFLSYQ